MNEIRKTLLDISHSWDKKIGLFVIGIILIGAYFSVVREIIKEGLPNLSFQTINIFIPIIISIVLIIIWLISTNRVPFPKKGDLTIGVFLYIDEEESEKRIKKIAKSTLLDIQNQFPKLKIKIYPINLINSKSKLNQYLKQNSHSLDSAILAEVTSGKRKDDNGNSDEILKINEITFSGKFNVRNKFKVFKTTISILDDLKIRHINKNWSYIEGNSSIDKIKLKTNLKDTILFYCGIYLIYLKKPEISIEILKTLHSKIDSTATLDIKNKEIKGNKNFISAIRLNDILLNLYISSSSKLYDKKNVKEAYNCLKECESIFGLHPLSYDHFISLARFSYELGHINEAKEYTRKAKNINNYKAAIFLNQGFFAIIDNDEEELHKNYVELSKVYKHKNNPFSYTEIISWLEDEKKKNKQNILLFEFAIGTLNLFYSDKELGRKILTEIRSKNLKTKYPKLYHLTNKFLTKGEIKSVYYKKYNKKKKKKKRKK